jgi:glycosyltransferase involved in cell wall biosynthesis
VKNGRLRHLGVNALFLQPRMGGIETYVRRVLPAMAELRPDLRISVFVSDRGRELLAAEPWVGAVELVHHRTLGLPGTRALTETLLLGALADRRGVEVVHSVAMTGPLRSRAARVLMVHDLIWLTHPDPGERFTARLWRAVVPRVARRSDRVISPSAATRREVVERLHVDGGRIDVIPHGRDEPQADPSPEPRMRARLGLGEGPIVLAVSAAKAHKNLPRLVQAMPSVVADHPDLTLVIPGNPTGLRQAVESLARDVGVAGNLRFPGWVDAPDLEGLYAACSCVVFPSLVEGFGMPVLEAMTRSAPVACSDASSLPEVGGDAVLYFDPLRPPDIAAALLRLLGDPELADRLKRAGAARSRQFCWRRTAEQTIATCERAAAYRLAIATRRSSTRS